VLLIPDALIFVKSSGQGLDRLAIPEHKQVARAAGTSHDGGVQEHGRRSAEAFTLEVLENAAYGLVSLCRGEWEDAADHPVPPEERDAILRDWATWAVPEGPHVFIVATHAGLAKVMPSQADVPGDGSEPDPAGSSG
jgi:hypothetical protein